MFFCFQDALLVRGNCIDLELKDKNPYHGWIEIKDDVYDPSRLLKFKKEVFYQLYKPTKIIRCNIEQYKKISKENKELLEEVQNTTLEDLQPNGKRRGQLFLIAPMLQALANVSKVEGFQQEVYQYFESIQYEPIELELPFQKRK